MSDYLEGIKARHAALRARVNKTAERLEAYLTYVDQVISAEQSARLEQLMAEWEAAHPEDGEPAPDSVGPNGEKLYLEDGAESAADDT